MKEINIIPMTVEEIQKAAGIKYVPGSAEEQSERDRLIMYILRTHIELDDRIAVAVEQDLISFESGKKQINIFKGGIALANNILKEGYHE